MFSGDGNRNPDTTSKRIKPRTSYGREFPFLVFLLSFCPLRRKANTGGTTLAWRDSEHINERHTCSGFCAEKEKTKVRPVSGVKEGGKRRDADEGVDVGGTRDCFSPFPTAHTRQGGIFAAALSLFDLSTRTIQLPASAFRFLRFFFFASRGSLSLPQ